MLAAIVIARWKWKFRFPTQPLLTLGGQGFSLLPGGGWNSVTFQVLNTHMWLMATILDNTYIEHCHRKTRGGEGSLVRYELRFGVRYCGTGRIQQRPSYWI